MKPLSVLTDDEEDINRKGFNAGFEEENVDIISKLSMAKASPANMAVQLNQVKEDPEPQQMLQIQDPVSLTFRNCILRVCQTRSDVQDLY